MEDGSGPAFQSVAGQLSLELERTVVNRTELTGRFDVHLRWSDQAAVAPDSAPPPAEPNAPSIFTAVQEQLGLRLEPGRAPLDQFVIDRVERPREN